MARLAYCAVKLAGLASCLLGGTLSLGVARAQAEGPLAGAAQVGAAPAAQTLQLVLPLRADYGALRRLADDVSTPGSPDYGRYRPIAVLAREYGARPGTRARVVAYLRRAGATGIRVDATGLFVDATMTAARAERLFEVPLSSFRAAHDVRFVSPASPVAVPAQLRGLITGVVGLDTRPLFGSGELPASSRIRRLEAHAAQADQGSGYLQAGGTPSGCAAALGTHGFTPNQYLAAYDYAALHNAGIDGQGERVALIEIDGFRYSDITTFAGCFGLPVPAINGFGVGVTHPLAPGGESTLDLEVLDAAAPKLKSINVYESSAGAAEALRAMTAPLQAAGSRPQVISASIGLCEQQVVGTVGASGVNATEASLEMAAASGISFLASSGDSGSADCVAADGDPLPELSVNYPASSPWVTGVGGTNFQLSAANQIESQVVWNDAEASPGSAGGGGFSQAFGLPSYQKGSTGGKRRVVPDVSMLADIAPGYAIYCTASPDCVNADFPDPWTSVGGTSAGTPLLAGGFALVDQDLRLHGVQALGLANPLLYRIGRSSAAGRVFYDITQGSNDIGPFVPSIGQPLGCCNAARGFDAASGWGSVDLNQLAGIALISQPKLVNVSLSLPRGQRPVARQAIQATVACTGACLMRAAARISIRGAAGFAVTSGDSHLSRRGKKTVSVKFSAKQLSQLRSALRRHKRITAAVTGQIVDPGGNVEKQTAPKVLTITG